MHTEHLYVGLCPVPIRYCKFFLYLSRLANSVLLCAASGTLDEEIAETAAETEDTTTGERKLQVLGGGHIVLYSDGDCCIFSRLLHGQFFAETNHQLYELSMILILQSKALCKN